MHWPEQIYKRKQPYKEKRKRTILTAISMEIIVDKYNAPGKRPSCKPSCCTKYKPLFTIWS